MKAEEYLNKESVFKALPPIYPDHLLKAIEGEVLKLKLAIVVLDDDPTGTQTVKDIPVLTTWNYEALEQEFSLGHPLFYILTNTRSMNATLAYRTVVEICQNLKQASSSTGRQLLVISRSDSTLRGHYPLEVEAVAAGLSYSSFQTVLIPAFFEGGRYTIEDVHYVQEGDQLVPAARTPFARDHTFGFLNSNLKAYVEEKTEGHIQSNDVLSLDLKQIRTKGPDYVYDTLKSADLNAVVVANAVDYQDLFVIAAGLLRTRHPLVLRTAASIVPALAGMEPASLIPQKAFRLAAGSKNVLVVVGSHVPKSTLQLNYLLKNAPELKPVELNVEEVINLPLATVTKKYADLVNRWLKEDHNVVFYTSRELITFQDKFESLAFSKKVSDTLTGVVAALEVMPGTIIAKGGITSSDIATTGLQVKRARIKGPVLPGVPVWELGAESKFPGMNYVVFPGNVGGEDAVFEVFRKVKG